MDTSQQVIVTKEKESSGVPPRQRRSIGEKRRIVEETLVEGASVARVARAHGINANQVFGWRRLYLSIANAVLWAARSMDYKQSKQFSS